MTPPRVRPRAIGSRARFAAAVAATAGACLVAFALVAVPNRTGEAIPPKDGVRAAGHLPHSPAPASEPGPRRNYPYSIVQGGVHSLAELREVVARDAMVAAHYALVDISRVRVETVAAGRRAYMSYRIGDRIYWTKQPVALQPGERILTDGRTEIRARCGNCVSSRPMEPVSGLEPDPEEFDRAIEPAPLGPSLLASTPLHEFYGAIPALDPPLGSAPHAPSLTLGGLPGDPGAEQPTSPVPPAVAIPAGPVVLVDPARTSEPPAETPPEPTPPEPPPPSVPEPASLVLVSIGLAGVAALRRRRARSAARPRGSVQS